jgi:hypothetical protein
MSDPRDDENPGQSSTGSQAGNEPDWGLVDSGQSDDIESSLTAQGVDDRETLDELDGEQA